MKEFYCSCELACSAAQAWVVLQLADGMFDPAWRGRKKKAGWGILIALTALSRMWNVMVWESQHYNAVFIAGVLILTAGSAALYTCRLPDAFCLNILGWGGLVLGDYLAWTLISLVMDKTGGPNDILLWADPVRGIYLLVWAAALLPAGMVLNRWIAGRRRELLSCRGTWFVLMVPLLLSILCFQLLPDQVIGHWAAFLLCCILMYLVILMSMVKDEVRSERKMQEMRASMLESRYQELLEIHQEHAILTHDMKNHMRMVGELIMRGKTEEAADYLSRVLGELAEGRDANWSSHESVDLILNMKFREARKNRIRVECRCDDLSGLSLPMIEICALFSNLLDNAMEANQRCPADVERRINLLCARREKMLMISLSNPVEEGLEGLGMRLFETVKGDRMLHGFGMRSVQRVVENHRGHMRAEVKDGEFCIVIYLAAFEE